MLHADLGIVPTTTTGQAAPAVRPAMMRAMATAGSAAAPEAGLRVRNASGAGVTPRYAFSAVPLCVRAGCQGRQHRVGKRY